MKNKTHDKLKKSLDNIAKPNYEEIRHIIENSSFEEKKVKNMKTKKNFNFKLALVPAVALGAAMIVFTSSDAPAYDSVYLDINPSFEMKVDKFNNVIDVLALNADATTVIDNINLDGKDLTQVIDEITTKSVESGYLSTETKDEILVSTNGTKEVLDFVNEAVKNALTKNEVSAVVNNQIVSDVTEAVTQTANDLGVSVGKVILAEQQNVPASENLEVITKNSDLDKEYVLNTTSQEMLDEYYTEYQKMYTLEMELDSLDKQLKDGLITKAEYKTKKDELEITIEIADDLLDDLEDTLEDMGYDYDDQIDLIEDKIENQYIESIVSENAEVTAIITEFDSLLAQEAELLASYMSGTITKIEYKEQLNSIAKQKDIYEDILDDIKDLEEDNELTEEKLNSILATKDQIDEVNQKINDLDLTEEQLDDYEDIAEDYSEFILENMVASEEAKTLLDSLLNGEISVDKFEDELEKLEDKYEIDDDNDVDDQDDNDNDDDNDDNDDDDDNDDNDDDDDNDDNDDDDQDDNDDDDEE